MMNTPRCLERWENSRNNVISTVDDEEYTKMFRTRRCTGQTMKYTKMFRTVEE